MPSVITSIVEIVNHDLAFILQRSSRSGLINALVRIQHMRVLAEVLLMHCWREFVLGSLIPSVVMLVWIRACRR